MWHPHLKRNWINDKEFVMEDRHWKEYPLSLSLLQVDQSEFLKEPNNPKLQCQCRFIKDIAAKPEKKEDTSFMQVSEKEASKPIDGEKRELEKIENMLNDLRNEKNLNQQDKQGSSAVINTAGSPITANSDPSQLVQQGIPQMALQQQLNPSVGFSQIPGQGILGQSQMQVNQPYMQIPINAQSQLNPLIGGNVNGYAFDGMRQDQSKEELISFLKMNNMLMNRIENMLERPQVSTNPQAYNSNMGQYPPNYQYQQFYQMPQQSNLYMSQSPFMR